MEGDALQNDDLLAVGRELETLHLPVSLRQLFAVCAVQLHAPDLTARDEGDSLVVEPCGVGLVLAASGQQALIAAFAVAVHYVENLMALVLFNTIVSHLIDHMLAVRRCLVRTDASHGPQGLRSHHATGQFNVAFSYHVVL